MNSNKDFLNSIFVGDLRTFLEFWLEFQYLAESFKSDLVKDKHLLFTDMTPSFSWYQLYEKPAIEHFKLGLNNHFDDENIAKLIDNFRHESNHLASLPAYSDQIDSYFESKPLLSKSDAEMVLGILAPVLAVSLSTCKSLESLLYYGRFLNDLIDEVKLGNDKALFQAISIDPTCIGCKPIIERISKAVFIQDKDFLNDLKNKIGNKPESLAQANYQKMRLVFEILYECGASKLSDAALYKLFVEELNLYYWDAKNGGNAKALRKFADTYMKKQATT